MSLPGFGIAGNFAHHLEQAGESGDFVDVVVAEANAPKGIFPFYLPDFEGYLGVDPLSSDTIYLYEGQNLQMEPEVVLHCSVTYRQGKVAQLTPLAFGAFNDCSIRREGASKISEKKNWGACSKGMSKTFIPIDRFSQGGVCDSYVLASYLKRQGTLHAYGESSTLLGYSYFYEKLLGWLCEKFATQTRVGPLEAVGEYLAQLEYPKELYISIGATRYTSFGEQHYLAVDDELFVILYDNTKQTTASIERALIEGSELDAVVLHQTVKKGVQ